jgi:ornithine cyclodeaminase
MVLMPSESMEFVGVKIVSVSKNNATLGLPTIHGIYVLMDAKSLRPLALIDGAALTSLRTPAVSALVAEKLCPAKVESFVIFGSGIQAWGHVLAMRSIREIECISIVGRDLDRTAALVARIEGLGQRSRVGDTDDVRESQLIVCATTSRNPLFEGDLVPDDSLTVAVGSHEKDSREISTSLVKRSQLVVEDIATALREAGDVIIPISEKAIDATSLLTMRNVIAEGVFVSDTKPRLFKSVGMSWEDLAIASEVYREHATARL